MSREIAMTARKAANDHLQWDVFFHMHLKFIHSAATHLYKQDSVHKTQSAQLLAVLCQKHTAQPFHIKAAFYLSVLILVVVKDVLFHPHTL